MAPSTAARRLAPGFLALLVQLAEVELKKGCHRSAERLARQALVRRPFNVDALTIVGLAREQRKQGVAADDAPTLAGN